MNVKFKDIIDTHRLQKMMNKFFKATSIPIGIIDTENEILVATGWQEVCTKFHRCNPITLKRCHDSDNFFSEEIRKEKYVEYKCKNGLWDIGIPIIVDGNHMASLFIGQFFYADEDIDFEFFKKQAHEVGFDEAEYLDTVKSTRIFERDELKHIIDYYADFADFISELAYKNLKLKKKVNTLEGLLPICCNCKKIRDEKGYWNQIEVYISKHTDASFTHGLCENCSRDLYLQKK